MEHCYICGTEIETEDDENLDFCHVCQHQLDNFDSIEYNDEFFVKNLDEDYLTERLFLGDNFEE